MAAARLHISRFTPSRMDQETLEAIFVQRQVMAADVVDRISDGVLHGDRHYQLFVGPRGCGKTYLVSLIYHRLKALLPLREKLRIAWLNEDKMSTSTLDLSRRIYKALSKSYPEEFPADALAALHEYGAVGAAKYLRGLLEEQLASKTALVIVENLDALFEGLGTEGQHQWRGFLQDSGKFSILATAQQLAPSLSDRAQPFFGFFHTHHLAPLTMQDGCALLENIAKRQQDEPLAAFLATREGRGRVRALQHLSGGNHRVYVIFSEFINRSSLDDLVTPFEKTLDELTPCYQERLRWLSPQQRMIVEHLCECKGAVSVKTISQALFTSNQSIATQLKKLKTKRYVCSATRGRESLYELTEPLMRLAIEMKEHGGGPLRLIVDFLRVWYSPREDFSANFGAAEVLLASGRWQEGWTEAARCLGDYPPAEVPGHAERLFIRIILRSTHNGEVWTARLAKLCEVYDAAGALTYLGEGLVRSLLYLRDEPLSQEGLARWRAAWHEVGDGYPALSFALRLFDVGLAYVRSGKPNELLDLGMEQRAILEQLFDIGVTHNEI